MKVSHASRNQSTEQFTAVEVRSAWLLLLLGPILFFAADRAVEVPNRSASGLAYGSAGRGDAAVVLIHGSNLDSRIWVHEIAWLQVDHRVIWYDLRAHGASPLPDQPFSAVDDLLELLDELAVPRASLVGLSSGARIAVDFALLHPERAERLVLVSPTISGYRPQQLPAFFGPLIEALQAGELKRATELLIASPIAQVPPPSQALVGETIRDNQRLWTVDPKLERPLAKPALERLEELEQPILVLVGDEDLPDSLEVGKLLSGRARNARLVEVEGGGHLLNLTSPQRIQQELQEFLQ